MGLLFALNTMTERKLTLPEVMIIGAALGATAALLTSCLPKLPELPEVPEIPELPEVPEIPEVSVPEVPEISLPQKPSFS